MRPPADHIEALRELAPSGTIRVAINIGNGATVTVSGDGTLTGPAPRLAERLALWSGLPIAITRFASAAEVIAAAEADDAWDIAFLAIEPDRADRFHFTPPYLLIEASFAVWADSPIRSMGDVDRPEVRIATSKGAAYDLVLQRSLRHACLVPFGGPRPSLEGFEKQRLDAVAGIRETLERTFDGRSDIRVLPGRFAAIKHGIAIPIHRPLAAALLERFIGETRDLLPADSGTVPAASSPDDGR